MHVLTHCRSREVPSPISGPDYSATVRADGTGLSLLTCDNVSVRAGQPRFVDFPIGYTHMKPRIAVGAIGREAYGI